MKGNSKKALYESIMTAVAKEVKRALNENDDQTTSSTTAVVDSSFDESTISDIDIHEIYNFGRLQNPKAKNDNIICDNLADYKKIAKCEWKSNTSILVKVIRDVIDALSDYITAKDITDDYIKIKKIIINKQDDVSPEDKDKLKKMYTIHLTNKDGEEIRTIQMLFNTSEYNIDNKRIYTTLRYSIVARRLANVAMWLSKIALQINNEFPISAACGLIGDNSKNIFASTRNIIQNDKECAILKAGLYKDTLDDYSILKPAYEILKYAKEYVKNRKL